MVITKRTKLERETENLRTTLCKRCGTKLIGRVKMSGLSVICPKCKRPL
ncbi:hypothetical protein HN451_07180 [archaeon]|jgi:hypothetical protein|nr:hypothetical protein [archaeon]